MAETQVKRGLRPTLRDERDLKLGALYTLPDVATLPDEFLLPTFIYNQRDTDFCSACAACQMSYAQEDVVLSPEYSFAKSKELSEDVNEWGQDLRTAFKVHQKYGALEQRLSPYDFDGNDSEFLRHIENWKIVEKKFNDVIEEHKKKSYFSVKGPYDHFDDIRAAMFKFKSAVGSGVDFGWPLSQAVLDTIPYDGEGHAIAYVGWTEGGKYLWMANSYGTEAGAHGLHKVSREVVNHYVAIYDAFMFVDIPKEDARYYIQTGTSPEWPWPKQMWHTIINIFK